MHPRLDRWRRIARWGGGIGLLAGAAMLVLGSQRSVQAGPAARPAPAEGAHRAGNPALASINCRRCHEAIYDEWAKSHHALAERSVNEALDGKAFEPTRHLQVEGVAYTVSWAHGHPHFVEKRPGRPDDHYLADYVIGHFPLRQYVVPVGGGRLQAAELAYDPAKGEWFDVFGSDHRHPGEWGYWRGRGMNWNSMCAACHMTQYHRNYHPATDTYTSTWLEQGVGCVQCHGDITPAHLTQNYGPPKSGPAALTRAQARRAMETCAPCHARNEMLTGAIRPGGRYVDQYRLTLPVQPGIFYPDGQMESEDYNYTSLLLSPMGGKAGVTCLDCHDPHTGKTILPVDNNRLCLQCHATGRLGAPIIHPEAHSHHKVGSIGDRCISCHMPTTVYMQRDPRHDHGFIRPDPLLTKELRIPNACNRCHKDKSVDWAIKATDRWYGAKMESRQRERARVVAAAQQGAAGAGAKLAGLISTEEIPAWKATLLLLGQPYLALEPRLQQEARKALGSPSALVRSAAVRALTTLPGDHAELRPLLHDPAKLVRLDAEWALSPELAAGSPARRELDAYMATAEDQPAGQARLGEDLFNRGRPREAETHLRRAAAWDPGSADILETLATVVNAEGRSADAAALFWRAAQIDSTRAEPAFDAGLTYAASGQMAEAEKALRAATRRNPRFARAWYNLGLALVQTGHPEEGLQALKRAAAIAPHVPDYPYAEATVYLHLGDRAAAIAAARRALQIDPGYLPARQILQTD